MPIIVPNDLKVVGKVYLLQTLQSFVGGIGQTGLEVQKRGRNTGEASKKQNTDSLHDDRRLNRLTSSNATLNVTRTRAATQGLWLSTHKIGGIQLLPHSCDSRLQERYYACGVAKEVVDMTMTAQSSASRAHSTLVYVSPAFIKQALKRAPFLVVGKTQPTTLPVYDIDRHFQYFFLSDRLAAYSCLTRKLLRRGKPSNPKALFPTDYLQCFEADAEVAADYSFPNVKDIVQHWDRHGINTVVHARKTAVVIQGETYVIGTFAPFDDVELGITTFRAQYLPRELPDPEVVPLRWFEGAFENLPLPVAVVDSGGNFLRVNAFMQHHVASVGWKKAAAECLEQVKMTRKCDRGKNAWEFSRVHTEDASSSETKKYRVWVWRPVVDWDMYAICFREHLSPSASGLLDVVKVALR